MRTSLFPPFPPYFHRISIFNFETYILVFLDHRVTVQYNPRAPLFILASNSGYMNLLSLQSLFILSVAIGSKLTVSNTGKLRPDSILTRPPLPQDRSPPTHELSPTMSCSTAVEIQDAQGESALMTSGSDFFLPFDLRRGVDWFQRTEKPKYDRSNVCVKCKENAGNIVIRHVVYCKLSSSFASGSVRNY